MIKYFRNTFLAVKVSFCNEMENFCKLKQIDYEKVKNIATLDDRITRSHSNVPGPDGKTRIWRNMFSKRYSFTFLSNERNGYCFHISYTHP